MKEIRYFPKIVTIKTDRGFEGMVCIGLRTILKGELLISQSGVEHEYKNFDHPLDPKTLHQVREALIHAVSTWDSNISIEMHITSFPDIACRVRGQIMISIFLRAFNSSETKMKELLMDHFFNLMPLLAIHFQEADFRPVKNQEELNSRWRPFNQTHAVSIQRREDYFSLAEPLKAISIGFVKKLEKSVSENHMVKHIFPWVPSYDHWERLLNLLMGQLDPIQIIIRLASSNDNRELIDRLTRTIHTCESFLSNIDGAQFTLNQQARLIRDISLKQLSRFMESNVVLGVSVLATHPIDPSFVNVIGRSITGPKDVSEMEHLLQGGFNFCDAEVRVVLRRDYFPEKEAFTPAEAACAFRLPSPPINELIGLPVKRHRTSYALLPDSTHRRKSSLKLFNNFHNNIFQPVSMDNEDRFRHAFILGQTGVGKSNLMEYMILQDIEADKGLAVIDPHGDMIDSIIENIPENRLQDVILFDLTDKVQPIGFNILQWRNIEERDLIIDELYIAIDRIYDLKQTGGPIFETNFRGMLKLLMGDKHRKDFTPTILDFLTCYLSGKFRDWLKRDIEDKNTIDFLEELERTGGDASLQNLSPYITSKFSRFTNDITLARIVGQEKTGFNFDDVINNGKIFLVKLGKGRFGPAVSALLANQIVSRFKLAAMKRGEMRVEERKDFFLYVDECQNLPSENFRELLSEARKYRIGLILSTQYAGQLRNPLSKENDLLAAILGNVGTSIVFRLGHEDADLLSPVFYPYFNQIDLTGLPNFEGYARLHSIHGAVPPFSFQTEKVKTENNIQIAKSVRQWSRLKYGIEAKEVDEQIRERRESWAKD